MDNTLINLESSLKKSILEKLFDTYRMIDPHTHHIIDTLDPNRSENTLKVHCYEIWGQSIPCENCLSKKAFKDNKAYFKIVYQGQKVFLVAAVPIQEEGKILIYEFIKDITESGLLGIEDKNDGLIHEVISDLNKKVNRDSLTGAYNGHYAFKMITKLIKQANVKQKPLTLFFIASITS